MKGLSPRAQRLMVALAQDEGRKLGSDQLLPEHVLLALLKSGDGLGYLSLQMMHINVLTLQLALEQSVPVRTPVSDFSDLPPSHRLRTMLDVAAVESRALHTEYIGTEHLLLAAIREEQSITWRFFQKAEITIDQVRALYRKGLLVKAPTGHRSMALPESSESSVPPWMVVISAYSPRLTMPSSITPAISSPKRTQRVQ